MTQLTLFFVLRSEGIVKASDGFNEVYRDFVQYYSLFFVHRTEPRKPKSFFLSPGHSSEVSIECTGKIKTRSMVYACIPIAASHFEVAAPSSWVIGKHMI